MDELEILQKDIDSLSQTLSGKLINKVDQSITTVSQDFIDFFSNHDFKIQKALRKITATSGSHQAVLEYPDPSTPYMGTEMPFDLTLHLTDKMNFIVLLNQKGKRFHVTTQILSSDPEQRLKDQIKEKQKTRENLVHRIDNFSNEVWDLELRLKNPHGAEIENSRFDSMKDLLETIIQFR